MSSRTPRRAARLKSATMAAGILAAVTCSALSASTANAASSGRYVALGDSYTAASGVFPLAPGIDPLCLQSQLNYPKVVAGSLGLNLTDVSCGAATVSNMTQAQYPDQPAQFNALGPDVTTVTLGIGGNDNELFASAIAACGTLGIADPLQIGSPCKSSYGSYFDDQIDSDAKNIAAAIRQIHTLSPAAKVVVVGYGAIMPHSGGCYPTVPVVRGDVPYLDGIEQHLNTMLAQQAAANNATFVDVYGPSVGHDSCKPVGTRWIEPPVSGQPVHPNALGESHTAVAVAAAITG